MSKPHCFGKMDWILKYPENETPKSAICDCQYTNSCMRHTRNRDANEPLELKVNILLKELETANEDYARLSVQSKQEQQQLKKEIDTFKQELEFAGKVKAQRDATISANLSQIVQLQDICHKLKQNLRSAINIICIECKLVNNSGGQPGRSDVCNHCEVLKFNRNMGDKI